MRNKFEVLPLKAELLKNLEDLGFESMTPIQTESLPLLLAGGDIIAQAKTGSGKTAAFGLAILNSLDISRKKIHSLILCPTRELAEQVAKELRMLARSLSNVKILTLCGGISESIHEDSLQMGVDIVVGTPGRVLRLLDKKLLDPSSIQIFTLDEADRMLDMGFHEDIIELASYLPKVRRTWLFSATYPDEIRNLSKELQNAATEVTVDVDHDAGNINQHFFELRPEQDKNDLLFKILANFRPDRLLVFCRTKKDSRDVAQFLINRGISAGCLNGDLEQNERTAIWIQFSNQSLSVLVATDVAARGLDIQDLAAVLNYNLPSDAESYVHRIGRTGRAGSTGLAFSFFNPVESFRLEEIEALTKQKIELFDRSKLSYTKKYDLVPPMQTMYISGGKKDKLRPGDIVGALVGEAKLAATDIGNITVLNVLSYVAIKRNSIGQAIERLSRGKIKKRKFKVGLVD